MKRLKISLILVIATAIVLVGGAAYGFFQLYGEQDVSATSAPALSPLVSTSGSLDGFYPGAERKIQVTIKNPNPYPITVSKVDAYSLKTKSGCAGFALESRAMDAALTRVQIPAAGSHTYPLVVFLNTWADTDCAGQHFTLKVRAYAGSAT
jgi:hypothetical protein